MSNTILVSGYFGGQGHDRKIGYFERLNRALESEGWKLTLFDLSPDPVETQLDVIRASYAVTLSKYLPAFLTSSAENMPQLMREAAAVEALIWNCRADQGASRVAQFARDFRAALQKTKAQRCVLWHQFNGLHHYAAAICESMGIPLVFAEYGELPGTVSLSAEGQMGLSLPAREPKKFAARPVSEAELAEVAAYIQQAATERRTRKPQSQNEQARTALEEAKAAGRPIVFYAGQNDPQAGLAPRWLPDAPIHSPHYEDTLDLLEHLGELAERNDWRLLFKPHPALTATHAALARERCPNATVIEGGDVFDCIDAAGVTVTLVSQVAYLALIRDKPAAVLGRIALSGSGCVYEAGTREAAEAAIQSAIQNGFTPEQRAARDRHFAQLRSRSLFAMDPDLEREKKKNDAVRFLIAATAEPSGSRVSEQLAPFQNAAIRVLAAVAYPLRAVLRR